MFICDKRSDEILDVIGKLEDKKNQACCQALNDMFKTLPLYKKVICNFLKKNARVLTFETSKKRTYVNIGSFFAGVP